MSKRLRGGSFNLKYGRNPGLVLREINRILDKHHLHFLCVQEANDYIKIVRSDPELVFVPTSESSESGIIVRHGVPISRQSKHVYGDGWITVRGGHFPAAEQHQVRLAGWLYLRSVHLPTPSEWEDGRLKSPPERKDDLVATSNGLVRYLRWPSKFNARLAVGDMNEPPATRGAFTPRWIAEKSGAKIYAPTSLEGHGRIDYVIAKGATVTPIFKDTTIVEGSDHEPVIFVVHKN